MTFILILTGCLLLESNITREFVNYKLYFHLIEIKYTKLSNNYENKIILTIDVNTQKIAKSFSSEESIVQEKNLLSRK